MRKELLDGNAQLAREGLTSDELRRAKKKIIGQQQIANQSNETLGYTAALDELYGLGFDHYKKLEAEIEAITVEDVKRIAQKYFLDRPHVIATVRPSGKT